jgi:hypothetical protein
MVWSIEGTAVTEMRGSNVQPVFLIFLLNFTRYITPYSHPAPYAHPASP